MTRRKTTDGERIAGTAWVAGLGGFTDEDREKLASDAYLLYLSRMADAWDQGNVSPGYLKDNPYRGRSRKK